MFQREGPDTIYGRLQESVHLAGYSFERACGELEWLLDDDRWQRVGGGHTDINSFLATIDFSEFRIALEQRKTLAKRLQAIQASQRATARLLGVDKETVRQDLGLRRRGGNPPEVLVSTTTRQEIGSSEEAGGGNPPAWFQSDVDPAKEAKRAALRAIKREQLGASIAETVWPRGTYGLIYADPPWRYDHVKTESRSLENQYPTMSLDELIALRHEVDRHAANDCVMVMWAPTQKIAEATALLAAWDFVVKSGAVWVKPSIGMGYWFRQRHELLILATRGEPKTPPEGDRMDSVIEAPRRGHSEKPDKVYAYLERMFPMVPKLELFARADRPGWARMSNETKLRSA